MITEEFKKTFTKFVIDHESEQLKIYDDRFGVPTIGIGFALINKVSDGWEAYTEKKLQDLGINLTAEQYKIIKDYAKAKTNGSDTSHLRSKLDRFDFTITQEMAQNLLQHSIQKKYDHIKNNIGEDKWDKLNLAQQVGVMDHAFQRGNILSLTESLIAGDYATTAKIIRQVNNEAFKTRAEPLD